MAANHLGVEQLSLLLDLSPRHVARLTESGVLKRAVNAEGKVIKPLQYELISNNRSYIAYLREAARLDDAGQTLYTQLRNKKMGAEAEKATLDLKLYKQKLHKAEDIEFVLTTMFTSLKSRLLAIPSRVTRVLMGRTVFQEIYSIIYTEIELALRELSEYDPNAFARASEDHLAFSGAAAPSNGNGNGNHHQSDEDAEAAADTFSE